MEAPNNRGTDTRPASAMLTEACLASVKGEIDNVTINDQALRSTIRQDILSVYHTYRSASRDRHLPAFQ